MTYKKTQQRANTLIPSIRPATSPSTHQFQLDALIVPQGPWIRVIRNYGLACTFLADRGSYPTFDTPRFKRKCHNLVYAMISDSCCYSLFCGQHMPQNCTYIITTVNIMVATRNEFASNRDASLGGASANAEKFDDPKKSMSKARRS